MKISSDAGRAGELAAILNNDDDRSMPMIMSEVKAARAANIAVCGVYILGCGRLSRNDGRGKRASTDEIHLVRACVCLQWANGACPCWKGVNHVYCKVNPRLQKLCTVQAEVVD